MKPRFRTARRTVQCLTFTAFILIPFLNAKEVTSLVGNLLGFNAFGIPLADPLSMTQTFLGTLSVTSEALIGAALSLLLAVLLGPVFCSWLCPYGFLSELVHPAHKNSTAGKKGKVSVHPFAMRCLITGFGLLAIMTVIPFPALNQISMPGWITRFWQSVFLFENILWIGLALPLILLIVEAVTGKRVWCRYFCPQSVLISLAGFLFPRRLRVHFTPRQCTCPAMEQACRGTCSLDLNPRRDSMAQQSQCTNCGDCIDVCRTKGNALAFVMGKKSSDKISQTPQTGA